MDKLYTASEARKKLGNMSTSSFKRLVDSGRIKKVTPPTKVQGYYVKEDVDKIAEELLKFAEVYTAGTPAERIEISLAQGINDIRETAQIARQHFGDNAYDVDKRMSWFNKVPNGDYVLKHEGIIVGYFSMQAIKPEAVEEVFAQKSGRSIILEDMDPIEPGKPLQIHISGIGVKTGISRKQAKIYGMLLLTGLFDTLISLGQHCIDIQTIWSKSSTVPGIKLSRDLGFTELGYINNEQIGFKLDTEKSDNPFIKKYRETLKASC